MKRLSTLTGARSWPLTSASPEKQKASGLADGAGQAARFPDIQRLFYRSGDRVRPLVNAATQWRPKSDLEVYADFHWQAFRNKIDDPSVTVELLICGQRHGDPRAPKRSLT